MTQPPLVIDCGTGFTKMGYADNSLPSYIVPTMIVEAEEKHVSRGKKDIADLDFYIGEEAQGLRRNYTPLTPIKHGIIDNWDVMEKFWQRCIFQYLRGDPEKHYVLLTEPPLNTPENREYTAEIMFETFNVPGLYIGVQAVLALIASWPSRKKLEDRSLTGTVVDSGDGATHVIPVVDGYVIGSSMKHIPMAGSDITKFTLDMLRERGEDMPAEEQILIAKKIKESYCYVCPDMVKEYKKWDTDASKFSQLDWIDSKTKKHHKIDVGYERFLGPEIFFNPEIFSSDHTVPLPELVDGCIQSSPIDCRLRLYNNVVLSGGSTMFQYFHRRLQKDLKEIVKERQDIHEKRAKGLELKRKANVKVISHSMQRFAVWFGGSMLASMPQFGSMAHSKEKYDEIGPRVARYSDVLKLL